ncbi:hypothetical protein DID88_009531 [Monilinia fructigena]|uniref:Major facilitator superfamily (MFS) profile domain-containing protein n=1 Tax=Monilinia fructigena TaxID=38457 RepID=A0A395IPA1_9HELO|nr:hypothetical protein DID88_009531 [Monilinia fructigena]
MTSGGMRQCIQDVTPYLLLLIFLSTLGPLQFGFHLSELNAPQDVITCKKESVTGSKVSTGLPQCIPMTETEFAALSSLFVIGGLLGALGSGAVSTSYGRLFCHENYKCLLHNRLSSGHICEHGSHDVCCRFIAGIGAGASTVVVPIYISEVAPPKERGLFRIHDTD